MLELIKNIAFISLLLTLNSSEKHEVEFVDTYHAHKGYGLIDAFELWEPPENSIYIDPENINDSMMDGSIEHPFNSFNNVSWNRNSVYAVKRGTQMEINHLVIEVSNVIIASYGEGDRPKINCTTTDKHAFQTNWIPVSNITLRDLEIEANNARSCITVGGNGAVGLKIINCKLSGADWGIRCANAYELYIENTEIFNTSDDGIFVKSTEGIEIKNCYIHNVNTNWVNQNTSEAQAAGDAIQFELCNKWKVYQNYIDRTSSGNKFCFISNNSSQNAGIFEQNYLTGPVYNGSGVYLGGGRDIIIRYNFISGPTDYPVYAHVVNLQVHNNIFYETANPLYISQSAKVFNNLFYNMNYAVQGGDIELKNNIFKTSTPSDELFKINNLKESHNIITNIFILPNSFFGKPEFENEAELNFHLKKGSDGIDDGINVDISYDFDGVSIPQGKSPDIGPFEYIE